MVAVRIFLLLLVLAEDANFFDVAIQEMPGNCSSGTAGWSDEEEESMGHFVAFLITPAIRPSSFLVFFFFSSNNRRCSCSSRMSSIT